MCQGRFHQPLGSHFLFISLFHFRIQNNTCFTSHKKADNSCDMKKAMAHAWLSPDCSPGSRFRSQVLSCSLYVLPGLVQPRGALPEGRRQQTSHLNPSPIRPPSDGTPDVSSDRLSRVPVCPPGCMDSISPAWSVVILVCPDGQFPWLLKISATLVFGRIEAAAKSST